MLGEGKQGCVSVNREKAVLCVYLLSKEKLNYICVYEAKTDEMLCTTFK